MRVKNRSFVGEEGPARAEFVNQALGKIVSRHTDCQTLWHAARWSRESRRGLRAQQIAAAMRGIRSYLDAHPNASDSLRGVRLWLRDLPEEPREEAVGIALKRLAGQGEIEARAVAGGPLVYGCWYTGARATSAGSRNRSGARPTRVGSDLGG